MIKKLKLKKYTAISQVIAVILLIGLTVLAGAALFLIVIPLLNNNNPVILSISPDAVFSTTESNNQIDSLVDTVTFHVSNEINEPIEINLANSSLFYADGISLSNWVVPFNNTAQLAGQQNNFAITFKTSANIGEQELNYTDQIYVKLNVTKYGQNDWSIFKSDIYTITKFNIQPVFAVTNPTTSITQSGSIVTFAALPNESVQTDLSVIVWNLGSPADPQVKRVSLNLENDTFFQIDSQYQEQTITIPSSDHLGFYGSGNICPSGYACKEVNFPITLVKVADLGYPSGINTSYGALLSLSGIEFMDYTLDIVTARLINFVLPNSLVAPGTGNGRIANSNLIYNGPFNAENSLDLSMTVWNGEDIPVSGNIFIQGLNTTAFSLDSPNITSVYIPNGTLPSDLSTCNPGDPCTTLSWTITRLPLKNGNQNTGIIAGAYNIEVRFLEFNSGLPVVLFINGPGNENSPYIYVNSVTWSKDINKNQVSSTVEIWDENFNTIKSAAVTAQWVKPDSSTVSLSGSTDAKGKLTFTQTLTQGTHTLKILGVSSTSHIYLPSDNKITNNQSSYLVDNTKYVFVNSITFTFNSAKGSTPATLVGDVIIYDQTNNPINGATVTVIWKNPNGINGSVTTATTQKIKSTNGDAQFSISSPISGVYTLYITSVSISGYDYKYTANVKSSAQTTVAMLFQSTVEKNMNNKIVYNSVQNQVTSFYFSLNFFIVYKFL